MEAKQIINGQWERALALTFQLKQIIIREACVDHVQLRRPGAGGACQEIAPRRIRLRSFSRSLGTRGDMWTPPVGAGCVCTFMIVHGIIIYYLWLQCKRNYQLDMGHCCLICMGCETVYIVLSLAVQWALICIQKRKERFEPVFYITASCQLTRQLIEWYIHLSLECI